MSRPYDLKAAVALGDLNRSLSRNLLHMIMDLGGTLEELREFMDRADSGDAWREFAKRIINAPIWKLEGQDFDLGPIDFYSSGDAFLTSHLDVATCINKHVLEGNISTYPTGPCTYRLHHRPDALQLYRLLNPLYKSLDQLSRKIEYAGWRELIAFAGHIGKMSLDGYQVLALGSHYVTPSGAYTVPILQTIGRTEVVWEAIATKESARVNNRRFFLTRVYPETSSAQS